MKHEQAVDLLLSVEASIVKLENTDVLRSTRCIVKLMFLNEKLSRLIQRNVEIVLDERDSLQLEF